MNSAGSSLPQKLSKCARTALMPTSCWPNTPAAAKKPCACTNKGWPLVSERWGRTHFNKTSAISGVSSKPVRTCVPGWGWLMLSGPLADVTRPCSICRTCSG